MASRGAVSVFLRLTFHSRKAHTLGFGTSAASKASHAVLAAELQLSEDHYVNPGSAGRCACSASPTRVGRARDPSEINLTPFVSGLQGVTAIARDRSARHGNSRSERSADQGRIPPARRTSPWKTLAGPGFALPSSARPERPVARSGCKAPQLRLAAAHQRAGRHHHFMTYDRARPLHVFDAAKAKQSHRAPRPHGETLKRWTSHLPLDSGDLRHRRRPWRGNRLAGSWRRGLRAATITHRRTDRIGAVNEINIAQPAASSASIRTPR